MQCELISKDVQRRLDSWLQNEYFDQETKQELLGITDTKEIEDRFYTDLEFGTGGMRGVIGAGTNRINKYIIRKISQGLADTIKDYGQVAVQKGVVIAYDSRRFSKEFALETALVLAGNGIKAYLFDSLRPTPELSFSVRYLKTIAGVNITASHNPKDYNGYKVYWEDGGQIPPDKANEIIAKINVRENWEVEICSKEKAFEKGLIVSVGEEIDRVYLEEIKKQMLFPQLTAQKGKNLRIVFTPLHGTGGNPVSRILQETGFASLYVVPEQEQPDSEFPTVKSPNPEDPKAFTIALKYAEQKQAHIIMGTDPDADRLGLCVLDEEGSYRQLSGNQIGVILSYYLLSQKKKLGILPNNATIVKSVASTDLGDAVAKKLGAQVVNVLVGFKFIGEQIKDMEEQGWGSFQFGFEESYGYLAGTYARDKDAVQAAALLAEAALYYQEKENKSLGDVLEEIHHLCGYYQDEQVAITLHGREGKQNICNIMARLQSANIRELGGLPIFSVEDFDEQKKTFIQENKQEPIHLPRANVLRFSFVGGGFVMARPSGTEPKIRFYFCVRGNTPQELNPLMTSVKEDFFTLFRDLIKE